MNDIIKEKRALLYEIYKEYGIYNYLPMSEAFSVEVPLVVGCSYNKCLFCDLNGPLSFRVFSDNEIRDKLSLIKKYYEGRKIPKKFVLMGANPLFLPTKRLIDIASLIKEFFEVDYIAGFARVRDILDKTNEELIALKNAGFDHLTLGLESGSNKALTFHNKGATKQENIEAMKKLEELNIKYTAYIILGFGGREFQSDHISETIDMLRDRHPKELIFISLVLFKNAKLVKKVRNGEFKRLNPKELMEEELLFLKKLDTHTLFNATHKNNAFPIKGILPDQREILIRKLESKIKEMKKSQRHHEASRWQSWSSEY